MTGGANSLARRNRRAGLVILCIAAGMVALAYASVPLYKLFCRVTGFGGTTQVAAAAPEKILARAVTVRLDASTSRDMPWHFAPAQRQVAVRLGEKALVSYRAENRSERPVTGTAVYNVTPAKAGKYFRKIECFCFGEQTLNPGEKVNMPVVFFVDPALDSDPDMKDVGAITLSYTFFPAGSSDLDRALEDFYNQDPGVSSE